MARNLKFDRGFHHDQTGALLCPAGLDWFDAELVLSFIFVFDPIEMSSRIKAKLRSGEMVVSGDQWPVFVYYANKYDPDDPWDGLFRSNLLVSVCSTHIPGIMKVIKFAGVQTHLYVAEFG